MKLTDDQRRELHAAILDAFNNATLDQLVQLEVPSAADHLGDGASLSARALQLIGWAEDSDQVRELVQGARRRNQTNGRLRAFENSLSAAAQPALPRPNLLDTAPFPWADQRATKFQDLLVAAYGTPQRINMHLAGAGVDTSAIDMSGAVRMLWFNAINGAAAQAKLRAVVEQAAADPAVARYHVELKAYL